MVITSFDGNNVNQATSYKVRIRNTNPVQRTIEVAASVRRNRGSYVDFINFAAMELVVSIMGADTATARATWMTNVQQWFNPWESDTRQLVATWYDGTTSVFLDVRVISLTKIQDNGSVMGTIYECVMRADYPFWQASSLTTSASGPATVTNGGNVIAQPTIELTTGTHKTLRQCTVVGAGAAGGLVACPIQFAVNDANVTATNVFVFINGISSPCAVVGAGGVSSKVWALIDTAADGSTTYVDIIYGSGITNPLCGTLSDPDLFDTTNTDNNSWRWDDWNVTTHPNFPGSWVPSVVGNHAAGVYQLTSDGGSVVFDLVTSGVSDYDSITVRVPLSPRGTPDPSLIGLSRVTANLGGTFAQAFVRSRLPNTDRWGTEWSTRANATVTASITFDIGFIVAAVGIENDGATADPATLTITDSGGVTRFSDNNLEPSVVVGAATNVDYYNGTYQVGSYTFTFTDCFAPDGTLTIDCLNRLITSSASGAIYNRPKPSDASFWATLPPGNTTITDGITATDVIKHRNTYS